jgi:aspartyl-tRNA(Asn)/glutamyl-tRNA(Gln) amidotransferase subunit B
MKTNTKLFSSAKNESFNDQSNSCVDWFDIALPGTLPVLNQDCVDMALRASIALKGTIPEYMRFD